MITTFNILWQIICIFSKSHLLTVVKSFIFLSSNVMSLVALTNINQITLHHLYLCSCCISIEKWTSEPEVVVTLMFSKRVSGCLFCWFHLYWVSCLVYVILFFIWKRNQRQLTPLGQVWSLSCDVSVASSITFLLYSLQKIPLCILLNYTRMKQTYLLSVSLVVWWPGFWSHTHYEIFILFICFHTSWTNCST